MTKLCLKYSRVKNRTLSGLGSEDHGYLDFCLTKITLLSWTFTEGAHYKRYKHMNILVFCLHVCICTMHMPAWYNEDQRRVLDFLGLEFCMVVSCRVGAGN